MPVAKLKVQGINTEADADRVQKALKEVWGIRDVRVDGSIGEVVFDWDDHAASMHDFEAALLSFGYRVME